MNHLPATGFLRLSDILGNPNESPPKFPIIPVSSTTWWAGVADGRYPKPVKISPRCTAWRIEDIRELIENLSEARA